MDYHRIKYKKWRSLATSANKLDIICGWRTDGHTQQYHLVGHNLRRENTYRRKQQYLLVKDLE